MKIMIHGSSMEPTLFEGEFYNAIKIKHLRDPVLKKGEIVVAVIDGETVVKRISKIRHSLNGTRYYDLKGDNRKSSRDFDSVNIWDIQYILKGPTVSTRLMRRWRRYAEAKK